MKTTRRISRHGSFAVTTPAVITVVAISEDEVLLDVDFDAVETPPDDGVCPTCTGYCANTWGTADDEDDIPTKANHCCPSCLRVHKVDPSDPGKCDTPGCGEVFTPGEINNGAIVSGPASYGKGHDEP